MYPKLSKTKTPEGEMTYTYVCKMKERSKRQRCSSPNVHGNVLDEAILAQIKGLRENNHSLIRQLEQYRRYFAGHTDSYETQLADLRAKHAQNERTVNGLIDSLGVMGNSPARPRVVKRMEELSAESNVLEKRILELEGMAAANSLDDGAFDRLQQILSTFCRSVEEMSVEEKRAAVRDLVHKVIWDGGRAHVVFWGADAEEISFVEIPGDG
jgi:site-specific DNA recombinase